RQCRRISVASFACARQCIAVPANHLRGAGGDVVLVGPAGGETQAPRSTASAERQPRPGVRRFWSGVVVVEAVVASVEREGFGRPGAGEDLELFFEHLETSALVR